MVGTMAKRKPPTAWAKRLRALRKKKRLDDTGMAALLGVSRRAWVSWLYNERTPSPAAQHLVKLAEENKI